MANTYIVVPIRIETKYLSASFMATSPLGDYTKLPWNNGSQDINFEVPFLGDAIIHHPFENQNLILEKGIHLHFIVPHYLGQHVPAHSQLANAGHLPAAPNTWLVTKTIGGTIINRWIIESDFIHDDTDTQPNSTCIIPFPSSGTGRPFRFMGRKTLSADQRAPGDTFKSLNNDKKPLTVVGYGDHNFSSFYPNCMGVFGFHDPDGTPATDLSYSILGWNSDQQDDLLFQFLTNNNADLDKINIQLQNLFKLDLHGEKIASDSIPKSVFYGKITVDQIPSTDTPDTSEIKIAVGNTGTEALSAWMGDTLSSDDQNLKSIIEDQLESMLLFSKLDHLLVDTGPKFLEARHEKGFRSSTSGHIWKIQADSTPVSDGAALPKLPPSLADALHKLNLAQFNYDKATHKIHCLREQLYLDWFRYMQAAYPPIEGRGQYPDPDHVRYFIETYTIPELKDLIKSTGSVDYGDGSTGYQLTADNPGADDLANKLYTAWRNVTDLANEPNNNKLSLVAAARFWEPNPPVIMISGLPLDASADDADSAALGPQFTNCILVSSEQELSLGQILTGNPAEDIQQKCSSADTKGQYIQNYSGKVWNPFILEWEADLVDTSMDDEQGRFDAAGITRNFNLDPFGPDLIKATVYTDGNLSVFSGSVIMSPNARRALLVNIKLFVKALLKQEKAFTDDHIDTFLNSGSWDAAIKCLNGVTDSAALQSQVYTTNPLYTAWMAYTTLLKNKVISQTLNGFNKACIMRRKTAQLPIAEPLGFKESRDFTETVKGLVLNTHDTSPITAFDFNPIRSGQMKLNRLRLIDNFGIPTDIDPGVTAKVFAETLKDGKGDFFFPPRFSQPARLNFRWLSATPLSSDENTFEDAENITETNDHPDTSPICGWLVANYLDNSLAVFDADGTALGYLDKDANWNLQPWVKGATDINANIPNTYLRKAVFWLNGDQKLLQDFLTSSQVALDNVAPANANQYTSQAILMGRPMAVVRARVSFQMKGLTALDQSWPALLTDLSNCDLEPSWTYDKRYNKSWTGIQLPFRLGEHHQLNDSLLGYWVEDSQGNFTGDFEAPETDSASVANKKIDTNFQTLSLALDTPLNLTLVVDPRGVVHATSGLLPAKAISIPPDHYLPAFKKIGMWFYTSPIVQPDASLNGKLLLNLPVIQGNAWQWWDKFGGVREISADELDKPTQGANTLIEGWLTLNPTPDKNNL